MIYADQILNQEALANAIDNGLVKVRLHPTWNFEIYNYTDLAQYQKGWNPVTKACRGLIVDSITGLVVARPFPKFFNYEELPKSRSRNLIRRDDPVEVTDKMDGSLGIMYMDPHGHPTIATRGSFTSDQALHATMVLAEKYSTFRPPQDWTLLFEIVYPDNRIVVDYQDMDDLVLLGGVEIATGLTAGPEIAPDWPGPKVEVMAYQTLAEAVSAPPRPGKEGLVVRFIETGERIKLKQADYVELHRIVTGLNTKEIWKRVMRADMETPAGQSRMERVLEGIPDEMHQWAKQVTAGLVGQWRDMWYSCQDGLKEVGGLNQYQTADGLDRKAFALAIADMPGYIKTVLFMWADNQTERAREFIWKQLEPKGDVKHNGI
jgi:RNA ligase